MSAEKPEMGGKVESRGTFWMHVFISVVIVAAVLVGVIVLYAPREMLVKIIVFRDFFDSALPILAFGALIKYLCMDWKK